MTGDFKAKAQRYEEMLVAANGSEPVPTQDDATKMPEAWRSAFLEQGLIQSPVVKASPEAVPDMVALMAMKADATSQNASFTETLVDQTVQFGQPYPAITHVEMWIGDRPNEKTEDNHFSTYLGATRGALWTSGLTDSKKFYSSAAWSAIPIFAPNVERRMRTECNLHCGTPYPSAAVLWQYPMSIWPFRSLSSLMDDGINAPAHCAALSARILRSAVPEISLPHASHWFGPSSLYLELSTPERMERALATQRPVVRSQAEEEQDDALADQLTLGSDDEVIGMSRPDARQALNALSVYVLKAGSRVKGADPDQDAKRAAEERFARGLMRYTWLYRKENAP